MSWFGRKRPGRRSRYEIFCDHENEGAAAGLEGKTREHCPYDEEQDPDAWNAWVFGCESAQGEMATIEAGEVFLATTGELPENFMEPGTGIPVKEAIEHGFWKPRYVKLPK